MEPAESSVNGVTAEAKKSLPQEREVKTIRRPARGYHKFRNGLLNVTPKGSEKEV